ncbi:MAG: tetratricopeptide repeat protein, partial [Trueperaceae bacterium]
SLRAAVDRMPDAVALHREIVRRAIAADDPSGAAAYLRDAVQRPLARTPSVFALASELPLDRSEAALDLLREGGEAFPNDVGLATAEARLHRRLGRPAEAEARLRPLEERGSSDLRWINEMALALLLQGRTEDGRALLTSAADDDVTARYNLGQALLEAGLPRAAAEELEPLAEERPDDADVWASYGVALAGAGRSGEARTALERALELVPDHGLASRGLNRLQERERIGGDAVEPLPQEAQAAFDRGLTDLEQGRFGSAVAAFRQAAEAAPDRALVAFYLGNALQRNGEPRDAIEVYDRAAEAYPGNGTILNNIGFAWLQLGRYDRALPTLRDAVAAAPENARAHLNLGLTYYGLSRYADALSSWEQATDLDAGLAPSIADARERARDRVEGGAP